MKRAVLYRGDSVRGVMRQKGTSVLLQVCRDTWRDTTIISMAGMNEQISLRGVLGSKGCRMIDIKLNILVDLTDEAVVQVAEYDIA